MVKITRKVFTHFKFLSSSFLLIQSRILVSLCYYKIVYIPFLGTWFRILLLLCFVIVYSLSRTQKIVLNLYPHHTANVHLIIIFCVFFLFVFYLFHSMFHVYEKLILIMCFLLLFFYEFPLSRKFTINCLYICNKF